MKFGEKRYYPLLMLSIFLLYWLYNSQYYGPAYLSDEVGYLTKAAAFAGHSIDLANHWNGGYSLILSPLFILFSDPFKIWQALILLNAAMWTLSFMVLFKLLRLFFSDRKKYEILLTVLISALYPSWISISGYAFSTTLFVLVFLLSILALFRFSFDNIASIIPHALLVGFLYWIHPAGILVAGASMLVLLVFSLRYKKYKIILFYSMAILSFLALYKFGVSYWLDQAMTPGNYKSLSKYKGVMSVIEVSTHPKFWLVWLIIAWGQFSALLVSTFGIVFYALIAIVKQIGRPKNISTAGTDTTRSYNIVLAFIVLAFLFVLLGSSVAFARNVIHSKLYIDYWIYTRYLEMIILPLFAFGVMTVWKYRSALIASLVVSLVGIVLHYYTSDLNTLHLNNLINIQSFWPRALIPDKSYFSWFLMGAAAILFAVVLGKRLFILLALPLWMLSIISQSDWHHRILADYSRPSGLLTYVATNYPKGECIGFDPFLPEDLSGFNRERRRLYSYYFFDYRIRRMSPEEWLEGCDGPYLTFRSEVFSGIEEAQLISKDKNSALYLFAKSKGLDRIHSNRFLGTTIDNNRSSNLARHTLKFNASELKKYSEVGDFIDGVIATNTKQGYLIFGPYFPIKKGKYILSIYGKFLNTNSAILDIVGHRGKKTYLKIKLSDYLKPGSGQISVPFELEDNVDDIGIKLHVTPGTRIILYSYSIIPEV